MKRFPPVLVFITSCCLLFSLPLLAPGQTDSFVKPTESLATGLFEADEILNIKLSGDLRELLNDRGDNPQYHPLIVSYKTEDDSEISIPAEARARGHFRKTKSMGDCTYPPLLLNFKRNDTLKASVFREQNKLKLVMPCKGDEYVIKEWLVYKIFNLVTPKSFKARLVTVELDDSKKKKPSSPFYGILLEEEQQMAQRNKLVSVDRMMLRPEQTEPNAFLTMAVFEYLIGNTDWSVQYLQNIKLLATDSISTPATVPYDFDHAGVVMTPYAKPAEELRMNSVRDRRYRGYCITDMQKFNDVIALYNNRKKDIYQLYTTSPLLDEKYIKSTVRYFDDFYETINNPKLLQKEFGYPCDKNGTGNVVIKGLKED